MIPVNLRFKKLALEAVLPAYATECSAGMDLTASRYQLMPPNCVSLIHTDLAVQISEGYELQVRSRSGLALKKGVIVMNSPGTIDADYRGEIGVILWNTSPALFEVFPGNRIAQIVLKRVERARIFEVPELDQTDRGSGGFGSTGR